MTARPWTVAGTGRRPLVHRDRRTGRRRGPRDLDHLKRNEPGLLSLMAEVLYAHLPRVPRYQGRPVAGLMRGDRVVDSSGLALSPEGER